MFSEDLKIIHRDPDLLVINKPSGLLSEGGFPKENDAQSLVEELIGRKAWACHRLDRVTSGVLLLRTTSRWTKQIADAFQKRAIRKEYWALVEGSWPKGVSRIETRIDREASGRFANVRSGGKVALSTVQVLGSNDAMNCTWVKLLLKTGRTHQARLHCQSVGCPVLGDTIYGGRAAGFFGLHARSMRLRHPASGESMEWLAEPPQSWTEVLSGCA